MDVITFVSTKVMDALKTIGLNLYERKLWVALLAKGAATAGELSQMSNVPRSRTYDTLESLAEKGFVMVQAGKPVRFVAIKPEEALERVKRKIEADTEETKKRIEELKKSAVARELADLFGKGVETILPEEMAVTIKGKNKLNQQMTSMIREANKKIQIVTNSEGLNDLHKHQFNYLKKAKARGVDIRIASIVEEQHIEIARSLSGVATVRVIASASAVKGNFCIVDGKELLFSLTEHGKIQEAKYVALWSKSGHVASDVLGPLFEMIWISAKPVSSEVNA